MLSAPLTLLLFFYYRLKFQYQESFFQVLRYYKSAKFSRFKIHTALQKELQVTLLQNFHPKNYFCASSVYLNFSVKHQRIISLHGKQTFHITRNRIKFYSLRRRHHVATEVILRTTTYSEYFFLSTRIYGKKLYCNLLHTTSTTSNNHTTYDKIFLLQPTKYINLNFNYLQNPTN